MKFRILVIAAIIFSALTINAQDVPDSLYTTFSDSVGLSPADSLTLAGFATSFTADSLQSPEKGSWVKQLAKARFNVNDSTINYPRFMRFCVKVYNWANNTFNSYDPDYVQPLGTKFKVMPKANVKWDTHDLKGYNGEPSIYINTQPAVCAGFRFSFLALGIEFMPDVNNLFKGKAIDHKLSRFTFNTSRLCAEFYMNKNEGLSYISKFGDYKKKSGSDIKYEGLSSMTLGCDIYYIFNHRKYCHGAGPAISKIQKRSAGSFLLGFQYTNQKLEFDFTKLPSELIEHKPWPVDHMALQHHDFAISGGYAFNWVFYPKWLFNITALPSIGFSRWVKDTYFIYPDNRFVVNMRGRASLVRHAGRFFFGLTGSFNGYIMWNKNYLLYSQIADVTFSAGYRF